MFNKMKISGKLASGFTAILLLLAISAFLGYRVSASLSENIQAITQDLQVKSNLAGDVADALNLSEKNLRDVVLDTDPARISIDTANISANTKKNAIRLDSLNKICVSPEEKKLLSDLAEVRSKYGKARSEILKLGLINTPESNKNAAEILYSDFEAFSIEYRKAARQLCEFQDKLMTKKTNEAIENASSSQSLILIIGIGAIVIGFLIQLFLSKGIKNTLLTLRNSIEKAISNAVNGNLSYRSDVKVVPLEFQPLLQGMNELVDSFVAPLNVSAEYIDRISKGDLPPKITDDYKGDFNEIKVNLNHCIDAVGLLVEDANMLVKAAVAGKLDTRANANRHQGDFRMVIAGVNDTLDAVIAPLNVAAEYVDRISKGDMPPIITDNYNGDFNELKNNLNQCISAIVGLVEDANMLSEAAINGKFSTRADVNKHAGDFAKVIKGVNNTLDIVVDKMVWYGAIIDATPFPIHVIDMDMNWTFLNKAFEKLMVEGKIVKDRNDAVGKPCCSAGANICNTDSCGIKQLHKGNGVSYFDWAGMQCKQDTSYMYNAKGEKIGYVEVVTDLSNILTLGEYNKVEVERLATNLNKLAIGSFDFNYNIGKPNEYTKEAHENFLNIDKNLERASLALQNITRIANEISKGNLDNEIILRSDEDQLMQALLTMTNSLNEFVADMNNMSVQHDEGDIDVKMLASKFNGAYKTMAMGVNKMVFGHIAVKKKSMACFEEFGKGNLDAQIEKFPGKKAFINDTIEKVRANIKSLVTDTNMLSNAAIEGKLAVRADAEKHHGDFRKIIEGINKTLDSIVEPINDAGFVLERLSLNDTTKAMSDKYVGDWVKFSNSVLLVGDRVKNTARIIKNMSHGDLTDIAELKKVGKRSEMDELMPSVIGIGVALEVVLIGIQEYIELIKAGEIEKINFDTNQYEGVYKEIFVGLNLAAKANVEPLLEVLDALGKMSNSDFTARVKGDYRGGFKGLKESYNLSMEQINSAFGEVLKTARGVENGANQVADSSTSLSQGATEQAASLEEMTSSMSEVASQTKRNAENANVANNLALEARNSSDKGEQEMKQLMKAMDEINESSKGIAKIIKVIDEIAFQTNLLALNAAVEAARAGVHGQGFAVVAEEVRNLAARSAQAAKETAEMIEGSIKTVDKGSHISQKTQEALNEIKVNVTKVNDIISEIAVSSNEQAQGIAQINLGLNQIDKVTQQNTATSEESATAADELSSQSRRLTSLILKFKLSGSDSADYSNERSSVRGRSSYHALPAANSYDDEFNIDLD